MQPGYGLPLIHQHYQQEVMDGDCCSPIFSISNSQNQNQNHHHHLYQPHPQHLQQQKQPQQISQQQRQQQIPITHQLFQQQHHQYQFQAFQQQNERLHHQLRLQQGNGSCQAPNPIFNVNFKLGLNENSGNKEGVLSLEQSGNTFPHGNEQNVTQNPPHSIVMPHSWNPQEDTAIKEPFWKPLERKLVSGSNMQCNEDKEHETEGNNKQLQEVHKSSERYKDLENKYRLFGELEAIYSLAKIGETNRTGSGSALTGENSPTNVGLSVPKSDVHGQNVDAICAGNTALGVDHGSEASIGEEASLRKIQKRKRKQKEKLSSMAEIFESLVKQVMDHQDGLHTKFLEVIERMDKQRTHREELWRSQEVAKYNKEAIARAHEQALASNREALIVSCIEKITGQCINLPSRKTPLLLQAEVTTKDPISEFEALIQRSPSMYDTNSRWPKAEVEALIQARSSLELRFQEPGLKGPLWEEVSSLMVSMGYQRNAKRCKEKWENINKYFKKTKVSGKRRSPNSKTCPYFDKLDQLYSRTPIICPPTIRPLINTDGGVQRQGYSELLEAFTTGRELGNAENPSDGKFEVPEMGSSKLDFDGIVDDNVEGGSNKKEKGNQEYANGGEEDDCNDHGD